LTAPDPCGLEVDLNAIRTYFTDLAAEETTMSDSTHDRIASDIASNDVVLYMKGTPVFPQCGFSAATVQILSNLGVKFKAVDVLKDPEVRSGIKEFSNWPTIPQLYVKGEFVGGCDILREMYEADELRPFLAEKGIALESV
jgi:monothiol glutaredoxin